MCKVDRLHLVLETLVDGQKPGQMGQTYLIRSGDDIPIIESSTEVPHRPYVVLRTFDDHDLRYGI